MGEPADDDTTPLTRGDLLALLNERDDQRDKAAQRKQPPKDLSELMERTAERTADILEERAEARRAQRDGDPAPTRNAKGGGTGFLGEFFGGGKG